MVPRDAGAGRSVAALIAGICVTQHEDEARLAMIRRHSAALVLAIVAFGRAVLAGPETALREFAGGQIKKGVRTIGMGGDGATTGNYALVYKDAGGALFDEGLVRFGDTGNFFTFSAAGFTTPPFWDDAAFYFLAVGQRAVA